MTTRAIIGLGRWTEQFIFTPGGGAWDGDRPLSNLGHMPLYRVGRTATGAYPDTSFVATCAAPVPVGLIGLIGHNADDSDTFDLDFYADAGMTQLVHRIEDEEFWPVVYDQTALPIEHEAFWSGKYPKRKRDLRRNPIRAVWIKETPLVQAIRCSVHRADTSKPFQLRLFDISFGHEVSVNPGWGLKYGFRFRTSAIEAECGHKEFLRRPKPNVWQGTIRYLPRDETLQHIYDGLEENDLDRPFLFFPFPDESLHWLRTVHFVRNENPGLFSMLSFGREEVPFSFEGVL